MQKGEEYARSQPTYEGLKHNKTSKGYATNNRSQPTYEGLKPDLAHGGGMGASAFPAYL